MVGIKKAAMVALAVIMALALASCSKGEEPTSVKAGSWSSDGKTFSNKWSKIQFKLPAGYRSGTDEELDQVYQSAKAVTETMGENSASAIKVTYDLLALKDPGDIPKLMLLYENLGDSSASVTTETYFSSMAKQFSAMVKSGITYTESDSKKVNLAGNSWDSKTYSIKGPTAEAIQQYLLFKRDNYMMTIVITSEEGYEAEVESLLDGFSALK
ncbi:MAG: hypothetical protein LBC41_10730 [Clostridiales bacterium]|jgi:hypothetical protein|nr:hypothetical protein [Clostridiales bacterium]